MSEYTAPSRLNPEKHQRGADKLSRIPIKVTRTETPMRKPKWIRAKAHSHPKVNEIKRLLREHNLSSVCEEAACPNLGECFSHGTATFMIMGAICTRRCPFCDVAHGRPDALDLGEPEHLAQAVATLKLKYVVITSVDRDDLRDGGAGHYANCIRSIRELTPETQIEVLVPDFRGRMEAALSALSEHTPDVFNHNLETVPRLYKEARPGSSYEWSLQLMQNYRREHPEIPTKSGLMVGIGEELDEVYQVMQDMRDHDVQMLTVGQYLQPSLDHLRLKRFVTPEEFKEIEVRGYEMGFTHVASGPMVRSSYHADLQAKDVLSAQEP